MRLFGTKPPKNQGFTHSKGENAQAGGAIIWIFIMIALFAALNYAITNNSRSGVSNISDKQAELAASEILDYSNSIKRAVHELQINGCDDTEISFQNAVIGGYSNPNSPSDNSCHVFHSNGGGLQYVEPNRDWLDNTNNTVSHYGTWYTSAQSAINGLGVDPVGSACAGGTSDPSCHELITGVPFIKRNICEEINKKLGWGTDDNGTPFKDSGNSYGYTSLSQPFDGDYAPASPHGMGLASPSNYSAITSGCIEGGLDPAAGTYSFFQVLIVR